MIQRGVRCLRALFPAHACHTRLRYLWCAAVRSRVSARCSDLEDSPRNAARCSGSTDPSILSGRR